MKYLTTLIVVFLVTLTGIYSQEVVLDMNVEDQYTQEKGPNMRHFFHFYIGGGMVADFGEEEGSKIKGWRSGQFVFGYRYKLKLLSFYSLGADLGYRSTDYFLEEREENSSNPSNPFTYYTEGIQRQVLNCQGIGLEVYQRINFGKRGNSLGKYLDLGFRGQWNFLTSETLVLKFEEYNFPQKKSRVKNKQLRYVEPFRYEATARLGFNKFILYGQYRLSDLFNHVKVYDNREVDIPELPRLIVGFQYAI